MFQATRNSRQESFLEADIEKRIADHVFSYGFANKGKKDLSIAVGQRDWAEVRWLCSWTRLVKKSNGCSLPGRWNAASGPDPSYY